jgi:hypothetical protein
MQPSIESRVETLEAIAAIHKLKALAWYHADRYDADAFAALFADDGVFEGAFQAHRGRRTIAANIKFWPFMIHYVMNPIIEVNGTEAEGRWYFLRPQTTPSQTGYLVGGWYEDRYVKIDGAWKFKSVKITNHFCTATDRAWANEPVR